MKTKSRSSSKKGTAEPKKLSLQVQLMQLFEKHRGELFKTNELSKLLAIKSDSSEYQDLRAALKKLESEGEILRGSRRRFGLPRPDQSIIEGILKMQTTGNAVVLPDEEFAVGDTVLIRARNLHAACQGDRVRVALFAERKNERPQGEVIEVLERAFAPVVGKIEQRRNGFVVRPETGKFTRDIVIAKRELGGAKEGDKVKVQLYEWVDEFREPEGKVLEVLGTSGSVKAEMEAIAAEYDLPAEFPPEVMQEALALPNKIAAAEIKRRLDLRESTTIFTIDPEDAKDFDDAVSLTPNDDGTVTLGVHIADVSHYVTEGSKLDEEALRRGTSVYLVGGVIPMLPERISNELCSLRPDEDKLTFSAFLTIDPATGKVLKSEFRRTVIRSAMRFSYEEAEKRILSGKGEFAELLQEMRELSEKMYALRHSEGSIDFETDEVRFKFDDEGNPIETYRKERLGSMRMIEDFMLAANRAVAESIVRKAKQSAPPFLYRIHADPDPAKIRDLAVLAKSLGYKLQTENPRPKTVQKFLDSIKGKPEEKLLNQLMLRAMAKAIYAEHNVGHFGLAFLHYTHFTSPIRRYPDLIVHRMLAEYQKKGGMSQERERHYNLILGAIADQTSGLERRATEAERASIKVAQMLLMKEHLGEEFDAVISGVTHFGLFIQLPNGAEGLLHIRELEGHYTFDEAHFSLIRQRGGRGFEQRGSKHRGDRHGKRRSKRSDEADRYRIGDPIRVQLVRIKEDRRELDFKLAES